MNYPSSWEKKEQSTGAVVAFAPKEGANDMFSAVVSIMVSSAPTGLSVPGLAAELSETLKQLIPDFVGVESVATTMSGNQAHRIVYAGKMGEVGLKWMQVFAIKNQKLYVVNYTARAPSFETHLALVQQIIDSFEII
ncbi:MAG: DcrB-related protein [Chloroflexi bacterium]|nr:DcrB-related protein [Chloroflexota bacterium]